ncbi:hypothetical protein K1719_028043 [Acacia pycnantha]|nr:hypothetical protein K1719_028043 [Acacia pycnantha]
MVRPILSNIRNEILILANTGYGLNASFMALFGRISRGIYAKATVVDVVVGKIERNISEEPLQQDEARLVLIPPDITCDAPSPTSRSSMALFGIAAMGSDDAVLSCTALVVCLHLLELILCVVVGLWARLIIGFVTEYYTGNANGTVQEVAGSCNISASTNVIFSLALGYKFVIIPIFAIAICIYVSFSFASMYDIAVAALGMMSTIANGLSIDSYGPISDNAGDIDEMANMPHRIRERTDALNAAGNTTTVIGKGFAIGSAALVSLALFGAFASKATISTVDVLNPKVFIGLVLMGAMLPYWFSAMTMKSVGRATLNMVEEVRRQFNTIPGLKDDANAKPNYARCVKICIDASIKEMILPGTLVMLTPLVVGIIFGVETVSSVLDGSLVSIV